jgi:hypothetical protein
MTVQCGRHPEPCPLANVQISYLPLVARHSGEWPYIWPLDNFAVRLKLPVAIYMATH